MGRYTLLLVLAAVAGGSYLSFNALRTRTETGDRRAGSQSAVLARQLAESGQAIALTSITGPEGFYDPRYDETVFEGTRSYRGGTIEFLDYPLPVTFGDGRQRASILVAGAHGEAKHRLKSVYDFDPMDFPGPVWLDVPYATANISQQATITSNTVIREPQVDPTKNTDLGLDKDCINKRTCFSLDEVTRELNKANGPAVPAWETSDPNDNDGKSRTADLNNGSSSADDLYYQLSNAARRSSPTNRILRGPQTLSGQIGAPDAITLVEGDVAVTGAVRGEGALVVEGDLRVSGQMEWTGLVVVRSEEQHLTVDLGDNTTITGALVVSQEAYPPGGHIDLTVFRAPKGSWPAAWGERGGESGAVLKPSPNWDPRQPFRWYEHTHRFDQPTDGNADRLAGLVRFVDQPAGNPQERYTGLDALLQYLGSRQVRVEFERVKGAHGHSVYEMAVEGRDAAKGDVAHGFQGTALEGPSAHRSAAFAARDLRRLTVQPRSRRSLKKLWDGSGSCDGGEWPYCVGENLNRRGALGVRIVGAGPSDKGKVYYEGTLYWHMQTGEEQNQYHTAKAEWQAGVASGETPFGTDLRMGPRVHIEYKGAPVVALAEKAGFKGNQVIHISTESDLTEVNQTRAGHPQPTSGPPASGGAPEGVPMTNPAPPPTPPTSNPMTNPAAPPRRPCPDGWEWDDGRWVCDD